MSVETIKAESDLLRGSLLAELAHTDPFFVEENVQVLKFHGIYQQDDRDVRRGRDRDYVFMVRAAVPGGVLSGEQYLVADELADWVGDGTIRITSRQGFQWHRVRKGSLKPMLWLLNQSLVTTLGACGDVVRNTVACPAQIDPVFDPGDWAARIATTFRPRTAAYWEIWLDGERVLSAHPADGEDEAEPIYGATYLPRKFKIGVASSGDNCIDVYINDIGILPVSNASGDLTGFTILVGGGQGRSHNNPDTYPRLASPFTTVEPEKLIDVVRTIVEVQRDNGNRADRKQARLKYLIDSWGLGPFRASVEERLGFSLPPAQPAVWHNYTDHFGWFQQTNGDWALGIAVETGRIRDNSDKLLRSGLREIVHRFLPEIRLTAQQNLLIGNVDEGDRTAIDEILSKHFISSAESLPPVVRDAMACVALPTCGLALTEAERVLPNTIEGIHELLLELGLEREAVSIRMTGCPNGCARPYTSEIGLVGRRKGVFDIHLGASADGTRLNDLVFELVPFGGVNQILHPLLRSWGQDRALGETFGDFCHRMGPDSLRAIAAGDSEGRE